jgi:hypothetical protein
MKHGNKMGPETGSMSSSASSNAKRSRLDSVVTRPPATTGAAHRPPKLANWLQGRGYPNRDPNRGTRGGGGNRRWTKGYGGLENNSYHEQHARGRYARGRYARGRVDVEDWEISTGEQKHKI